jgi:cobalamin biosynthesis protein CobD/CbiB
LRIDAPQCRCAVFLGDKNDLLFSKPAIQSTHPTQVPGFAPLCREFCVKKEKLMWTVLILLLLCILSLYFYLPLVVIVILLAALISGAAATLCFPWKKQKQPASEVKRPAPVEAIVERETDLNS